MRCGLSNCTVPAHQPDYGFDVISEEFQKRDDQTYSMGFPPPAPAPQGGLWTPCSPRGPGWPQDHKADDTFDLPPLVKVNAKVEGEVVNTERTAAPEVWGGPADDAAFLADLTDTAEVSTEYSAEFTKRGGAQLILTTTSKYHTVRPIADFNNMDDARTAAEALNNHKGY